MSGIFQGSTDVGCRYDSLGAISSGKKGIWLLLRAAQQATSE